MPEISETLDHLETAFHKPKGASDYGHGHASLVVTRRTEHTFYTRILHFITRRFRRFLGRPKGEHPEGSVPVRPPRVIKKTCKVSERKVDDVYMYDIVPRKIKALEAAKKRIYYFAGGGWQSPPSPQHWQLCAKLARQVPETAVTLVSIPLAPTHAAPVGFPMLLGLYRTLMRMSEEEGHKVILAGDSSGGNVVLSLVLEALREDEGTKAQSAEGDLKHVPHPVALMVISPSTDLTRANPDIEKRKGVDPILDPGFIKQTAKAWRGEWEATDPRVSPLFARIDLLARQGIHVHGMTGSYDILAPDAVLFRNKLAENGVHGEWLDWEKQMHCFVLTWPYGLHEGREAVGWMVRILKKE